MIPLSTIKLLRKWAQWGQGVNLNYPTLSPMFGERALKSPLFGIGHIPDDVGQMELAVCHLDCNSRDIIIQRYQRHRTYTQIAERLGYSRWTIRRRIREAESEVHRLLEEIYCNPAPTGVHIAAR